MKKLKIIIIFFILIFFTADTVLSYEYDSNKTNLVNSGLKTGTEVIYDDLLINNSFYEIADLEYNEKTYNCKNKSEDFASVLYQERVGNIQLVTIQHETGQYSHMVVLWDGKIYDPTMTPPTFGMPEKKYLDMIKKYGFRGIMYKMPYKGKKT
ncbi:MAG: hypothetical protein KO217_00325 [Methanobacteriaceae archaeon]|nr:MAG: hypothetical protein CIT01_10110 [Methanobacterium sp. BRmetb2]MCC7557114.1 hypothetical protein [Methanobacteriaceae archaeon]